MIFILAALIALFGSPSVSAHPLDVGLLNLKTLPGNAVSVRLELNPALVAQLLAISTSQINEGALKSRSTEIDRLTLGTGKVRLNGEICPWEQHPTVQWVDAQNLTLTSLVHCPHDTGELTMDLDFIHSLSKTFSLLVRAELNGNEHIGGMDPLQTSVRFSMNQAPASSISRFIVMGTEHIGVAPGQWGVGQGEFHLPAGIDHILFVLALLLSGGTLLGLLRTVTGFTLGHSVSLAVATLGLIQFSGKWIEAAIAVTIAFVAAENLLKKKLSHQWRITIGIGLIHGLGFAAALRDLQLNRMGLIRAVVGFNLGVEAGQLVIVAIAGPLFFLIGKTDTGRRFVLPAFSFMILILASYWAIKRSMG